MKLKEEIYEILYVLKPELEEAEIDAVHKRLMDTMSAAGGSLRRESKWGRRRLAYEVNKFREGHYIFVEFNGTGQTVKELNDFVRLEGPIIRHLITGVPKAKMEEEKRREELAQKKAEEAQRQVEAARLAEAARAAEEAEKAAEEARREEPVVALADEEAAALLQAQLSEEASAARPEPVSESTQGATSSPVEQEAARQPQEPSESKGG